MRAYLYLIITLPFIIASCKNINEKKSTAPEQVVETPKVEAPKIKVSTIDDIGSWTMPITNQISNKVTLKFDVNKKKYYTKEKMSNSNKTDSLGVIITKKGQGYHIEYSGSLKDNYTIDDSGGIIWNCPGYSPVKCKGTISLHNLGESFKMYKPDAKARWVATSSLSPEQAAKVFEWSQRYVKACVVEPESVIFPNVKDVKFFSRNGEGYKIEYKSTGKNLYKQTVTYPVSIIFENLDDPILHTISLE